ncbi:MAG: DegT/DnrJ/EryC1/StrS family aminotransferase [Nitrososphaerota archaeon]
MVKIPFFKPPPLEFDEIQYIEGLLEVILDSGQLTNGQFCRELEDMVKSIYNVKHVITVSSGTAGLWLVLKALKSKHVIMPSFTWKSLLEIIPERVTWLDIDPDSWLPQVTGREEGDTYIINLTFGNVDDYSEVVPEDKFLVYDGAHAFGSAIPDIGNATVFSLAATKPFTTCEGGLILTDDDQIAEKLVKLRDSCARMSEIHAVIGQVFLGKLGNILSQRARIWDYYRRYIPYKHQKILRSTSYSVYGFLADNREEIIERVKDKMEVKTYYEPLYRGLPNTEYVANRIICIPSYVGVDMVEVVKLCRGR